MKANLSILRDITPNQVSEEETLKQALEKLDRVPVKVLLVMGKGDAFVATLTDGDARRAILAGASLETLVEKIANYSPMYLDYDDVYIAQKYLEKVTALPILDADHKVQKVYVANANMKKDRQEKLNLPVVIMAGGLGTRLYPYTKILPKPLIPVGDTPISERIIQSFLNLGCGPIHMVVNYKGNMIRAYFNDSGYEISFWDESEPLGTGGGLSLLKDFIEETFILTNCDILMMHDIKEIIEHHRREKNKATMVCSLKNFVIPYGIVNFSEGGEIKSFEEKPQMSFFTNTGYYILEKEVFQYVGKSEKIGMPDVIDRMRSSGEKVGIYPIGENDWLDMGQFDTMEIMERKLKELDLY